MMFTAILGIVGLLLTIARLIWGVFSPASRLRRLELWLERRKAHGEAERERQAADNARVDAEPDKTGQDLVDKLNDEFGGRL